MPPLTEPPSGERPLLPTLRRFLPYLWPADAPMLRVRIMVSMGLVVASVVVQIGTQFAMQDAINGMAKGDRSATLLIMALAVGYATARFGGVLFDNFRNVVFERVGQEATRRLASNVFRHLHRLSLRFHLERRTGAVTKVVERGTKSIDTMLYFLLFNIAPTVLQLVAVLYIFQSKFGWGCRSVPGISSTGARAAPAGDCGQLSAAASVAGATDSGGPSAWAAAGAAATRTATMLSSVRAWRARMASSVPAGPQHPVGVLRKFGGGPSLGGP